MLVLVLALVWFSHFNPIVGLVPSRDSGVFLYVGQQLNRGLSLYRDLADIKGPLLYAFNAWSLTLFGESAWAPYIGEFLLLCAGTLLGYFGLRGRFGAVPAAVGTAAWLLLVNRHASGNMAEEWAWVFQWGAVYLLCRRPHPEPPGVRRAGRLLAVGALGAAAFFVKMTCAGLWAALVVAEAAGALLRRRGRRLLKDMGFLAAGAGAVTLLVLLFVALKGDLGGLVRQYFQFPFAYVGHPSFSDRLGVLTDGLHRVGFVTAVAVAAMWLLILVRCVRSRTSQIDPFMVLVLVWLPIEIAVSSLAGRGGRYTWTWLPAIAVLVGVAADAARLRGRRRVLVALLALALLGPLPQLAQSLRAVGGSLVHAEAYVSASDPRPVHEAVRRITGATRSGDTVLVWGDYSDEVNFLAQRQSPTRYVFQPFLYSRAYLDYDLVPTFLSDLRRDPPALILDSSPDADASTPKPPLSSVGRGWPGGDDEFARQWGSVGTWVRENYELTGRLPASGWLVYERRDAVR